MLLSWRWCSWRKCCNNCYRNERKSLYVVDKSKKRLEELHKQFGDKIIPTESDKTDLKKLISECDLLNWWCFNSRS